MNRTSGEDTEAAVSVAAIAARIVGRTHDRTDTGVRPYRDGR